MERIPHEQDCSQFYHCFNGVRYGSTCRGELAFDSVTRRCVESGYAKCGTVKETIETTTRWESVKKWSLPEVKLDLDTICNKYCLGKIFFPELEWLE